ncbi:MAG: ABC transporter ATP-binding protein, partial [Halobacteriales archaeon]
TEGVLQREVGRVRAVDGIDFEIRRGETFGLIGETGCGKSTAARTLLHLESPTAGEVVYRGDRVGAFDRAELKRFRRRAQMVFQDPADSFNPRMTVGEAVAEPLAVHGLDDPDRREALVADALERVNVPPDAADRYPHQFSSGQKQRIALARALVLNPTLLVADEPVSALDVSVQAAVLGLLEDLQARFGLTMLLISHDMGVVREVCDRVAVMYAGELVEVGPVEAVFADPHHPYTAALLEAVPEPDVHAEPARGLGGDVPDPVDPPAGCRFHPRCPAVIQPSGVDHPDNAWRGVMALRVALRGGADRERAGSLRSRYGIPDPLPDDDAEAALAAALDALRDGEAERARERLAATFASPCERTPDDRAPAGDRRVACHLYEP